MSAVVHDTPFDLVERRRQICVACPRFAECRAVPGRLRSWLRAETECPEGKHPSAAEWDRGQWGPPLWRRMHETARRWIASPPADLPGAIAILLRELAAAIPCKECRGHLSELIAGDPPEAAGAAAFFAWTVWLHNAVNARVGTRGDWTVAEALAALDLPLPVSRVVTPCGAELRAR